MRRDSSLGPQLPAFGAGEGRRLNPRRPGGRL
jgi:hypothetical protein